jgi:phosphate transport system substrate-binding protein
MTNALESGIRKSMLRTLLVLASTAVVTQAGAETLIIQGSTTFARQIMEPHKEAIEADAKHELTLIPNKSMPGLIALMDGRAHMAMISASLKNETEALQKIAPGLPYDRLQTHEIFHTRIALALHPSNHIRKASLNQVRKILLGEITNWNALGGADLPIRVVMVGGGGGVTMVIRSELLSGQRPEGTHIIYVRTPVQLVQVIQQEPGAIGFAQLALTKQKGLPELVTERPVEQTLSLITLGDPTPAMSDVIRATRRASEKAM